MGRQARKLVHAAIPLRNLQVLAEGFNRFPGYPHLAQGTSRPATPLSLSRLRLSVPGQQEPDPWRAVRVLFEAVAPAWGPVEEGQYSQRRSYSERELAALSTLEPLDWHEGDVRRVSE
ncbi:MAG: hypothetical protein ACREJ6_06750, partial [Candidatus Methylomirabilis sp.]